MKKLLGLFCAFLLLSCNEKETFAEQNNDSVKADGNFVQIEAIYAKNDKLSVYCKGKNQEYKADPTVSRMVYASNELQTIEIPLPKYADLENLRIDLSVNPSQTLVTIKNVTIHYDGKKIDGDYAEFTKYFGFNEYVSWDPLYFGYKFNNVNNTFYPAMFGNDALKQKLTAK